MRPFAVRLLTLAISASVAVPLATASDSEASSRHIRTHHQRTHLGATIAFRHSPAAVEARPTASSWSRGGDVCPGNSRGIDCRIWPPPFDEDSDRNSGDGGGG